MSKVIVIGCGADSKMAHEIMKEYGNSEILFYEKTENIPISERGLKSIECHNFTLMPRVELPFIPQQKKGHERPYKYHR